VPDTIVPIPPNGMLQRDALPMYATAFAAAIDETEALKPGVDMFNLLKTAAVKEQYAIKRAYANLRPKTVQDAAIARAAVVNQWLVDIRTNASPAPWGRDIAIQIINDPKRVYTQRFARNPDAVIVGPINPPPGNDDDDQGRSSSFLGPVVGGVAGFVVGGPVGAAAGAALGAVLLKGN
jgi:hypothetical protein